MKEYLLLRLSDDVYLLKYALNQMYCKIRSNTPFRSGHTFARAPEWDRYIVLETDNLEEAEGAYLLELL